MIVAMKKVTLFTLSVDRESALEALRDLGVMQISTADRFSGDSAAASEKLAVLHRVGQLLDRTAEDNALPAPENADGDAAAIVDETLKIQSRRMSIQSELSEIHRRLETLAVWGDFDRALLDKLNASGLTVRLCYGSDEDLRSAAADGRWQCVEIHRSKGRAAFAVVAAGTVDESALPVVKLSADDDPRRLRSSADALKKEDGELAARLIALAKKRGSVAAAEAECAGVLDFCRARDSVAAHGDVSTLTGFVPAPRMDRLREAAQENGWGILAVDPGPGDNVPVLLENKGLAKIIKPLFDFLDITPGYRELDVSGAVMIFFTIFYAMIVGDAGYGILFLLGTVFGMIALKNKPAAAMPLRLMLILSIATVVWGVLCGSYFGLSFGGLKCLTDPAVKNRSIQFFCFVLAVAQLSVGRLWQAWRDRKWRSVGSNVGWMLVIWGNFLLTVLLLIKPEGFNPVRAMYGFYGIGLLLIILCGINWKDPAAVFQFPFSIIGSFTDVLSYIRLFAVGMAGACIATSFNGIGSSVIRSNPWLLLLGVLVILFGHLLNLALAMMSVLVHAVRLNTLEFSNHAGLTWSGQKFSPFQKKTGGNK